MIYPKLHIASILAFAAGTAAAPNFSPLEEKKEGEEVVFQESFSGKLSEGWTWGREDKAAWRIAAKGLEIRTQPGNLWGKANDAKNLLHRELPDASKDGIIAEVTVANEPTEQYEQAGITWYYDDSNMVKLMKELVDGKVHVVMGREENDSTRTIALIPIAKPAASFCLRLRAQAGKVTGFYRFSDKEAWQEAGSCELPRVKGSARVCLQTYNGPAKSEHWAAFSGLIVRRVKG